MAKGEKCLLIMKGIQDLSKREWNELMKSFGFY